MEKYLSEGSHGNLPKRVLGDITGKILEGISEGLKSCRIFSMECIEEFSEWKFGRISEEVCEKFSKEILGENYGRILNFKFTEEIPESFSKEIRKKIYWGISEEIHGSFCRWDI